MFSYTHIRFKCMAWHDIFHTRNHATIFTFLIIFFLRCWTLLCMSNVRFILHCARKKNFHGTLFRLHWVSRSPVLSSFYLPQGQYKRNGRVTIFFGQAREWKKRHAHYEMCNSEFRWSFLPIGKSINITDSKEPTDEFGQLFFFHIYWNVVWISLTSELHIVISFCNFRSVFQQTNANVRV